MSKSIEFYFDFGSPTSYLAYKRLLQVSKETGVNIDYKPVLLGGIFQGSSNQSPAFVPMKSVWMDVDMNRYAERYGVELKQNPFFPINTITLMRGALVAQENDCFDHYVETVFNAMWCDPENLGDIEVLAARLSAADLDAKAILEATQQGHIKEKLKQVTADALERKLFGCPTMFYGDEFFFGQDRIFFIEEMIAREQG
jgi:2-hydroxychromene-2-carboxylate isomerase